MTEKTSYGKQDVQLFLQGEQTHCYKFMGAHKAECDGQEGYRFTVWAPWARSVCVSGEFDQWSGNRHYMKPVGDSGIWETFASDAREGMLYKYIIEAPSGELFYKADPYAFSAEKRPGTASRIADLSYRWGDGDWMERRKARSHFESPLNIYEVHLGS